MIVREQTISTGASLLLHCEGTDGSTSFPDSSGNNFTVTAVAGAQVDTGQAKFGTASALFDGTQDLLQLTGEAAYAFGTGDFTIDLWFRMAVAGTYTRLYQGGANGVANRPIIICYTDNRLYYKIEEEGVTAITGTTVLIADTWYHVAVTRASGITRMFLNGVQEGSNYSDSTNYSVSASYPVLGNNLNGWMDEIRIIKGSAAWTANFTPPVSAYASLGQPFTTSAMPVIGYDTILNVGNITASDADANFPASNLANPATHLKWQESLNSPLQHDIYLTIANLSGNESPPIYRMFDYLAIARHNFGTSGCTLTVQASTADSPDNFSDIVSSTPIDDEPIIFQFVPRQSASVRLKIAGGTVLRYCAVLYCGQSLTLERSVKVDVDHKPINLGRKNSVINGYSESGNFVGRILRNRTNESVAEFAHFTNDWYRAYFDPFVADAAEHPFFIAWAPNDYVADLGFVWLTEDVEPLMNPVTRRFSATLKVRGIA